MPRPCPGPAASPRRPCGHGRSARSWQCAHGPRGRSWSPPRPARARRGPALEHARELLKTGAVRRVAVVCPTTPLTRQWARAAARLGVHLVPDAARAAPAARLQRRRGHLRPGGERGRALGGQCGGATLVIADEAHHLGEELAWGEGFARAFGRDDALAAALGHALPLRPVPDPGRALRRRRRRARRLLQLRRRRPRRHLPPGHLRPLRRRAAVAQRRGARRVVLRRRRHRARGGPALPHGDLPRAGRRPAAHPRRRARAPGAGARRRPPRRGRARRRRRRRARPRGGQGAAGDHRARADRRPAHRGARGGEAAGLHALLRALAGRGQHGQRGRRHPAPARGRLRDGGQDAARLPPDRGALRAHAPRAARSSPAGSSCPPTRSCARTPPRSSASCATSCARRARTMASRSTSSTSGARPSAARPRRSSRWRPTWRPQMALFGRAHPRRRAPGRRRSRRRSTSPTRRRCRPSSAARCCATSATDWWPTCAAARAARHAEINRWLNRSSGVRRVEDASIEQLERSIDLLLRRLSAQTVNRAGNGVGRGPCQRKR